MERQESLISINKKESLRELFFILDYEKLISYFGNVNSSIMILGLAPVMSHYTSDSQMCFKFDTQLDSKNNKSGGVLIKVFNELNIQIKDFYFDNVYKVPLEIVRNSSLFITLLNKEISIIRPSKIICLGVDVFNVVKNLKLNDIKVERIEHPAFVLRGGMKIDNYIKKWEKILYE